MNDLLATLNMYLVVEREGSSNNKTPQLSQILPHPHHTHTRLQYTYSNHTHSLTQPYWNNSLPSIISSCHYRSSVRNPFNHHGLVLDRPRSHFEQFLSLRIPPSDTERLFCSKMSSRSQRPILTTFLDRSLSSLACLCLCLR